MQVVDAQRRRRRGVDEPRGDGRASARCSPDADGYSARTVARLAEGEGPFRVVARRVDHQARARTSCTSPAASSGSTTAPTSLERPPAGRSLPALLLLVGVDHLGGDRAARLRPVEAMRREVEVIGAEDLHRRVPEPGTEDEIGRLARTMNAMLGRLEDATERQRRFVADASHELRSPLTGIRAQLEVDLAHPEHGELAGDRARRARRRHPVAAPRRRPPRRSRPPTRRRSTPPTATRSTSTRSCSPKRVGSRSRTSHRASTRSAVSGAQVDGQRRSARAGRCATCSTTRRGTRRRRSRSSLHRVRDRRDAQRRRRRPRHPDRTSGTGSSSASPASTTRAIVRRRRDRARPRHRPRGRRLPRWDDHDRRQRWWRRGALHHVPAPHPGRIAGRTDHGPGGLAARASRWRTRRRRGAAARGSSGARPRGRGAGGTAGGSGGASNGPRRTSRSGSLAVPPLHHRHRGRLL